MSCQVRALALIGSSWLLGACAATTASTPSVSSRMLEMAPSVTVVPCDRQLPFEFPPGVVRLGGDPSDRAGRIVTRVEPVYTRQAFDQGVVGLVGVRAVIRADGSVSDVCLLNSLHPDLDASVVAAAAAWRWEPATRRGAPVASLTSLQFYFDGRSPTATRPPALSPEVVAETAVVLCGSRSRAPGLPSGQSAGVEFPVEIETVRATYPPAVLAAGITGTVTLEYIVRADGSVGDVCVRESVHPDLDAAAVAKIRATRYEPARLNGEPIAMPLVATIGFQASRP